MFRRVAPLGLGLGALMVGYVTVNASSGEHQDKVVIVGTGAGGIGVMGFLSRAGFKNITVVDPSEVHYYQPYWTLVGGGHRVKEQSVRPMKDLIPHDVRWLKEAATTFSPEENSVTLSNGQSIKYDYLVVATGIQINWNQIPGLAEALAKPDSGVVSIYNPDYSSKTWDAITNFQGSRAFFTFPTTPVKCGGAPQKIMWLFESTMRKRGKRDGIDIRYWVPGTAMFAVKRYSDMLDVERQERGVTLETKKELVKVDGNSKVATFKSIPDGILQDEKFDLLHVAPPMAPPDVIRQSPLADKAGWVDVDKYTLRHTKYPNVFALGDCTNLPTSKTAAAITGQAPVVVHNLQQAVAGKPLDGRYNGYTSCPLVVDYGKVILAEFGYDGKIMESFGRDTGKFPLSLLGQHGVIQHRLFWWFKEAGFPLAYWNLWPRGLWYGTTGPFKPDVTQCS